MLSNSGRKWLVVVCVCAAVFCLLRNPQAQQPVPVPPNAQYAGAQTCATCHAAQSATQPHTDMAHALTSCANCEVLRRHPQLRVKLGAYTYAIVRKDEQSFYTVSDGKDTLTAPVVWCFGKGAAGQTYLLRHNGQWYESRVSFYQATNGLDTTIGTPPQSPASLREAFGRALNSVETKDCFSCHATAVVRNNQLQLEQLTPGITCEACHGPGAEHVALLRDTAATPRQSPSAKPNALRIFNPAQLSPYDLSQQFCGACHRSWEQVKLMELRGVENVRFQPYRLAESRCYDPEDRRISCVGCHNPHEATRTGKNAYDANCRACHQPNSKQPAAGKRLRTCPKSQANCASCHMPKYELPGSHFKFTDHLIRIVKPGENYPQ